MGEAVGADFTAFLVAPAGLAVEGAEGDREDGAFGQGLAAGVADDGPAGGVERNLLGAGAGTGAVGEPEDALAVGTLEGTGEEEAVAGGFQQGEDGDGPCACLGGGGVLVLGGDRVDLGEGGEMVDLVDYQQGAVAAELGKVEVGGGGDGLVGGDVAGQAAGGVRGVVGGTDGKGVIEGGAPGRVGEGFLGLEAEGFAGDDPDNPVDEVGSDEAGGGDDGEEGFAAAGGDGGEDVPEVGFTGGDGGDDAGELGLVGAEGLDRGVLGSAGD